MAVVLKDLRHKIHTAIMAAVGGEVQIDETPVGNVHVFVQSEAFVGLTDSARDRLVWPALERALTEDELLRISVCVLNTPAEHKTAVGY